MNVQRQTHSRRRFLAASSLSIPTFVSARALGLGAVAAASDRLSIGIVGLGSRGFNLLETFLAAPDAEVTSLCDVQSLHYRDRPWGRGQANGLQAAAKYVAQHSAESESSYAKEQLFLTDDFRELCSQDDLDVVVVATPDHWHALCTLTALSAGKDVYCEKPLTHTFAEGQRVYRAVATNNAILQTGSQQRSEDVFQIAVQQVRSGRIGNLQQIEVGLPPGYEIPQGDATIEQPPENLDYARWTGPAPLLPYMRARHHRWWRGTRAYGGGVLMDWIGHHNDIAHWAMQLDGGGPIRVTATGWTEPKTEIYDTPHHYQIECEYKSGVTSSISSRHPVGTKFIGDDGWLFVTRGKLEASNPDWLRDVSRTKRDRLGGTKQHVANFLRCVKTRETPIAPAIAAHRSITPGHLGFVSHALRRPLRWDPENEQILDDPEAHRLLMKTEYRPPWQLL